MEPQIPMVINEILPNFKAKIRKMEKIDYYNYIFTIPFLEDPLKKSSTAIYGVRNRTDFTEVLKLLCVADFRVTQALKAQLF